MTREDFDDIRHRMPFVLTSDEIPEYQILYVGKQREDELGTYVFDIAPKQIEKNKRYFQGRIWVDDHDFQIVKSYGKNVPDIGVGKKHGRKGENRFPSSPPGELLIDRISIGSRPTPKSTTLLHFSTGDVHVGPEGEIHQLQAVWREVANHLRRPGDLQGQRAAIGDAAAGQHHASAQTVEKTTLRSTVEPGSGPDRASSTAL